MRPFEKIAASACVLMLGGLVASGHLGPARAQEGSGSVRSARGGALARTVRHQFEVFFYSTGLRVFPLDPAGGPIDVAKLTGTATFYHPNSPKPWFARPLSASPASPGQSPASLDLVLDLSTVPPSGAKVAFEVAGLPDPAEPTARFTVPFKFVKTQAESTATAQPPMRGEVAPSPRYVYGPGYYGFGYYERPGPAAAPAPSSVDIPRIFSYGSSGPVHNWATGRDYQVGGMLSRPWLKPVD
jgi:hypothetical protein